MHIGKLSNRELEEIVLSRLPRLSSNVITGARVGVDCAWINLDSQMIVASTDPITAGGMQSGSLAIHVSCNDIAASGIRPTAILLVIIAPPSTTKEDLITIIDQASAVAEDLGIDIVGGHTEISDAVNRFVVTTTAFGVVDKTDLIPMGHAKPGDTLLMTKTAGIEGTWIAAMEHEDKLSRVCSEAVINEAKTFYSKLGVVREGVLATACFPKNGSKNPDGYPYSAVHLMHDATEGGILGAAYEMAELSGTGLTIESFKIPIHPVTQAITHGLGIDPLRLIASGSMLIATAQPDDIINKLKGYNIDCTAIGQFTQQGFFEMNQAGEETVLRPPEADELYRIIN